MCIVTAQLLLIVTLFILYHHYILYIVCVPSLHICILYRCLCTIICYCDNTKHVSATVIASYVLYTQFKNLFQCCTHSRNVEKKENKMNN